MIQQYFYQIAIIDVSTGTRLATIPIDNTRELRYSRILNGIGRVAITFPANTQYSNTLNLDNFIEIYRSNPLSGTLEVEETYLIRIVERFLDEGEEWIVIGGLSLNHLLTRRVVDPEDDPLESGGYSTKAGLADIVIASYVDEQLGSSASTDRRLPNFTVKPPLGVGKSLGARLQHEKLYNEVKRMALQGGVDLYIRRTEGNQIQLEVEPIGTDKTYTTNWPVTPWVGFSLKRGNIESYNYDLDRSEELNFVYALGPGNVGDRTILKVPGTGVNDSPYNRMEFVQDARNVEKGDVLGLLSEARGGLVEKRYHEVYSFTPMIGVPGSVYRMDWDIGDRVSSILDNSSDGTQNIIDLRITEVEISVNEGEEQISVEATTQWQEAEAF